MARAAKKGAKPAKSAAPARAAAKGSPKKPAAKAVVKKAVAKPAAVAKGGQKPKSQKAVPAAKPSAKKAAKVTASKKSAKAPVEKRGQAPVEAAPVPKAARPAPPKAEPEPAKPLPPKKPRKPEVTPKMIEKIKETLEAQRVALLREFTDLEEGAFSLSQSDMSGEASFDEEYADAGSFTFEREKELSIGNNIRDLLEKVNHALDRIERGTYGLCENCGDPINKDRLLALPYSSLCIRCKQQEERTR